MSTSFFSSALLVEDEPNLMATLRVALSRLGIAVHASSTLLDARNLLKTFTPELVLLDRTLPDGDGLDLCIELRKNHFRGAILILTASGKLEDRVRGLNHGADDYLPKPFSWEELEARIGALGRRTAGFQLSGGGLEPVWQLNPDQLQILGPKGWIQLTPLEFKLAARLISHPGQIVSRSALLHEVWGFRFLPKTRTVDHFMGRLRKYFEENPEEPRHFLTIRGAGYRFEPTSRVVSALDGYTRQ